MKKEKELKAVLTAVFAINRTSENQDKDISLILDYAFRTFFGANTNLLILACAGKTKQEIMGEVEGILHSFTNYEEYLEEYKNATV